MKEKPVGSRKDLGRNKKNGGCGDGGNSKDRKSKGRDSRRGTSTEEITLVLHLVLIVENQITGRRIVRINTSLFPSVTIVAKMAIF